ncbi:unnamed protein product [Rhodiola kirilowii]
MVTGERLKRVERTFSNQLGLNDYTRKRRKSIGFWYYILGDDFLVRELVGAKCDHWSLAILFQQLVLI